MENSVLNYDVVAENTQLVLENNIKNYLKRIKNRPINTSKTCCDCKDLIDERRLAVIPEALRCIDCASEFDARQRFEKQLRSTRGVIQNMTT